MTETGLWETGRKILASLLLTWLIASPADAAQRVRPSDRVHQAVRVYAAPSGGSAIIGQLGLQESVPLEKVTSPGWYGVRLPDGQLGYVARSWTLLFDDAGPAFATPSVPFHLHLIDVGTGLAVFVEGPGFSLLYDGGSNDDTADGPANRVAAYLRHIHPGLKAIDHVILSHPHRDHVQLLPDILSTYEIRNVWDSGIPNLICPYRAFLRVIRDRQIPYHDAHTTMAPHVVPFNRKASCGGADGGAGNMVIPHAEHIHTLAPLTLGSSAKMTFLYADATQHSSFNQNSLVMLLELGKSRILFMGDAEAGGRKDPAATPTKSSIEGRLLACCAAMLRSDILVVGHHGSMTSSRHAFIASTGAHLFLVSSGPTKYDDVTLPDPEVIDELRESGTVYETDESDASCPSNPVKIGPDNDHEPGGCDNLVIGLDGAGRIDVAWDRSGD